MEMITRHYLVAGHKFYLTLPQSEKLWGALERQYLPFEVQGGDASNDLFGVELVETLEHGELECIYDAPAEPDETVVRLYRTNCCEYGKGWLFQLQVTSSMPLCATVLCDEKFSRAKLKLETRHVCDAVFGINNAAMLLFAFAAAPLNTLEFHASVVNYGGKAYLFLGKSGTGKSTHSSLWLKHLDGTELMNDDNPVVKVEADGSVVAYGSPWSGKTPCYKNIHAPVGAFVQIRQCPENKIRRMSVIETYGIFFSSVSGIKDDRFDMADSLNSSLDKVISAVPCYLLDCRPDREAAELCNRTII